MTDEELRLKEVYFTYLCPSAYDLAGMGIHTSQLSIFFKFQGSFYYEEFEIYEKLDRILYTEHLKECFAIFAASFFVENLKQVLYIISLQLLKKLFSYNHTAVFTHFLQYFSYLCFQLLNSSQPLSLLLFLYLFGFYPKAGSCDSQVLAQDLFCFLRPSAKEVGSREGKCIGILQGAV